MKDTDIFELALGLSSPWKVKESIFDPEPKRLDIVLHFAQGSTFACPDCEQTQRIQNKQEFNRYDLSHWQ